MTRRPESNRCWGCDGGQECNCTVNDQKDKLQVKNPLIPHVTITSALQNHDTHKDKIKKGN